MPSTSTIYLALEDMANGEKDNSWGDIADRNMMMIERTLCGVRDLVVADTSGATIITLTNFQLGDHHHAVFRLIGALTADRVVEVPAKQRVAIWENATTGGFAVTVRVNAQTGVKIPNGKTALVYNNGTDVKAVVVAPVGEGSALVSNINADQITAGTIGFARLPVANDGDASAAAVVRANDARLSNARAPTAHTHSAGSITGLGSAATADTGTTSGTIPLLTTGGALPAVSAANLTNVTPSDGSVTFAKLAADLIASQGEAEAGTSNLKLMTPQRVRNAMAKWTEATGAVATGPVVSGLPTPPIAWRVFLRPTAGDQGYSTADELPVEAFSGMGGSNRGIASWANGPIIGITVGSGGTPQIPHKSTGSVSAINLASWEVVVIYQL